MDGFSEYLKDIVRYPLLNKEQEITALKSSTQSVATPCPHMSIGGLGSPLAVI
jgi:hypothetical protein